MKTIISIASTTVGEAVRRRVLLVILLIGLLFLIVAPALNILTARQERTVLVGLTLGVIQLTSALIAIMLTVYMVPNEIERRTIYTILSKPVQRWQFLVGKYLGAVAALGMMIGFMTIVLLLTFALSQGERSPAALAPLVKAPLMNFFQMSLLSAVALMFSTFVSPLVNIFLSSGIYMLGTLFSPLFQTLVESPSVNSLTKTFARIIHFVLPNFSSFNVQNPLINPGQVLVDEKLYFVTTIGYAFLYIGILIVTAVLIFDRREV